MCCGRLHTCVGPSSARHVEHVFWVLFKHHITMLQACSMSSKGDFMSRLISLAIQSTLSHVAGGAIDQRAQLLADRCLLFGHALQPVGNLETVKQVAAYQSAVDCLVYIQLFRITFIWASQPVCGLRWHREYLACSIRFLMLVL